MTRYKIQEIQEALFCVGYIITDNISNYSYFPTKHIIKLIINKCKTGCKKKYILVKKITQGFLQAEKSVMINKHIIHVYQKIYHSVLRTMWYILATVIWYILATFLHYASDASARMMRLLRKDQRISLNISNKGVIKSRQLTEP